MEDAPFGEDVTLEPADVQVGKSDAFEPPKNYPCLACPASPPSLGAKCPGPVFCEYPDAAFSCSSNCTGTHWITDALPDAGVDADPECPSVRPLMGSECDAGAHSCALGKAFLFDDVFAIVVARSYSCRCGTWQLEGDVTYGPPPPC